ncbi:MAG: hypothetical protein J6K17_13335 [Oscillospiraceae bacterium]|nr:hypothetical protein [Oscillospiraceae bacterium]
MKIMKNEKGYMIVEATIIYPVVLLCTIALLLVSLYLYERANVQASAEIALTYCKNQMTDTYVSFDAENMYGEDSNSASTLSRFNTANVFRVFSVDAEGTEKRFKELFHKVYGHESFSNGSLEITEFKISGALFYKTIDVTIVDKINIPINLSMIGIDDDSIIYTIKLKTAVNDSDQFIRDFDIAKEFVLFLVEKSKLDDKIKVVTDKFVGFYNKYLVPSA